MNKPLLSIIIPTFHEAENIRDLVLQIDDVLTRAKHRYEVIIVDDDSRDGIDTVVESIADTYPLRLHIRTGEKGLSSAVIKGISLAEGDIYVVMDADLSHPPSKIVELIEPIVQGRSEFVIGSRNVEGGSNLHFNWFRKLNAWVSRTLALPLVPVKDPMSGFFALPWHIMPKTDQLNPIGFKIGLELLVKSQPRNVIEIPIQFQKRMYGTSKLSLREQIQYLLHLSRLYQYRYKNIVQFVRFSFVGASGVLVNLLFVYLSYNLLKFPYYLSLIIGFTCAMTSNYILNKLVTFHEAIQTNPVLQYFKFLLVSIAGLLINMIVSLSLYDYVLFFHRFYLVTTLFGIMCGLVVNFMGSRLFVFREQHGH